jgi:hypothetical protein
VKGRPFWDALQQNKIESVRAWQQCFKIPKRQQRALKSKIGKAKTNTRREGG